MRHVGIYLGNNLVFHHLPGKNEHISTVEDFAAGHPVTFERNPSVNVVQLNWRVEERLRAPKQYHATDYNCEDAANYVLHGKAGSPQVQFWVAAILLVALGVGLVIANGLSAAGKRR